MNMAWDEWEQSKAAAASRADTAQMGLNQASAGASAKAGCAPS
jgi:hypothetical protein